MEVGSLEEHSLTFVRGELGYIVLGTVFVFFGLACCAVAAIRRRTEVRVLVWLGIWSAMYGARLLAETPAVVNALPPWLRTGGPYLVTAVTYLVVVAGLLAWAELTLGKMRLFVQAMAVPGLAIGVAGIAWYAATGESNKFLLYNNLVAAGPLVVLTTVVVTPRLATKYLAFPNRILAAATLLFTVEGLYTNLSFLLHLPSLASYFLNEIAFAAFLFSFAYVAARKVFANERRLLSIESELEIARQIQSSILPASIPEVENLRIAASYQPMSAVAGDFYEFLPGNGRRVGLLVADVSGHGVPAALIASMIKVAVQSVAPCAHDPAEVLRRLNRILPSQPRGQLVTAAYLWVDMEIRKAWYSAAGHPPLLRWREGKLKRIESNGILFGVTAEPDYPVCEMPLKEGDRFLLYTDGVVEPENAAGEAFGESRLELVIRDNAWRPGEEFSRQLLAEIRDWQPATATQQDDITLIVIDVVA